MQESAAIENKVLKPGDVLFDTSKPLDTAYFILEGEVNLTLQLGGKEQTLVIEKNHFVGDAAVVVTEKKDSDALSYHGLAVAKTEVLVAPIPISDIQAELERCSPLLRAWFASFTTRVLKVMENLSAS